jgi:predicted dehydrogenase/uncharacterized membrane protein YfcA
MPDPSAAGIHTLLASASPGAGDRGRRRRLADHAPALLAAGLPPVIANASNTVTRQSGAAFADREGMPAWDRSLLSLAAIAMLGSVAGAVLLLLTPERAFTALVPALIGGAPALFACSERIRRRLDGRRAVRRMPMATRLALFAPIAVYGGYFGAGMSVMLLAALSAAFYGELRTANVVKNLLSGLTSVVAVAVFAAQGMVAWAPALVMMVGVFVGGFAGGRLARVLPARWLRTAVIAVGSTVVYARRHWLVTAPALRIAAIEVSHWHARHDSPTSATSSPCRRRAGRHPDASAAILAERAAALGGPPAFTDAARMLDETRPDFVIALGRHRGMASTAHLLLDRGVPFLMEKPMGISAVEVRGIADRSAARGAFVAVPFIQRCQPFTARARQVLAEGRLGPVSHFYFRLNRPTSARYPGWGSPWMLDLAEAGGGCLRNLGPHGLDLFRFVLGEEAEVTGAQLSGRALGQPVEDYASVLLRSASGVIGTVEVGNTYPGDGTDGEWKIAGGDGFLAMKDGALRLRTRGGMTRSPRGDRSPWRCSRPRRADHFRRGQPAPAGAEDCASPR